jgi:hypothetical protein
MRNQKASQQPGLKPAQTSPNTAPDQAELNRNIGRAVGSLQDRRNRPALQVGNSRQDKYAARGSGTQ